MPNRDVVPISPSTNNCGHSLATEAPALSYRTEVLGSTKLSTIKPLVYGTCTWRDPLPHRTERFGINKAFDHQTVGIWDLYIEKPSIKWHIPRCPFIADRAQLIGDLQCVWWAVHDLSGILLLADMAVSAALALSPVVSLW